MSTLCGPSREPGVWAARVFRAALLVTSWWGAAVPKALAQECLAGAVPIGVLVPAGGDFVADCSRPYLLVDAAGGNRSFLVLPPCNASSCAGSNGANMLRCLLENGYACCIHAGDVVQTEAGQYTGALVPGLQARWDRDTDRRSDICYGQYLGNGARVLQVPIIRPTAPGSSQATVVVLAEFFLGHRPSGGGDRAVYGEFVQKLAP